jgi:hypothetical protein
MGEITERSQTGEALTSGKDNAFTPVYEMFIHVLVGTGLFLAFGLPAIFLNIAVAQLRIFNIDPLILDGLTFCEYVLFGLGVALFVIFSIRTAWKAIERIW